jgi:hypothetical protein
LQWWTFLNFWSIIKNINFTEKHLGFQISTHFPIKSYVKLCPKMVGKLELWWAKNYTFWKEPPQHHTHHIQFQITEITITLRLSQSNCIISSGSHVEFWNGTKSQILRSTTGTVLQSMFRYGHGISEKKMLTYEDDGYKVLTIGHMVLWTSWPKNKTIVLVYTNNTLSQKKNGMTTKKTINLKWENQPK